MKSNLWSAFRPDRQYENDFSLSPTYLGGPAKVPEYNLSLFIYIRKNGLQGNTQSAQCTGLIYSEAMALWIMEEISPPNKKILVPQCAMTNP